MASLTKGIFIVAAKRTPFGAFGGQLAKLTPTDLQEIACKAALAAGNIKADMIDSTVIGNVISSSAVDTCYISRHVALRCGVPLAAPSLTVNRLCGSGFQSIVNGAHEIIMGDSEIVMTGGSDSMSLAPYALRNIRFGTKLGQEMGLEDCLWASLTDHGCKTAMGVTAENLAKKYKVTRADADQFALASQTNWSKANQSGDFKDEIVSIPIKVKKETKEMTQDEHPKPQTTIEGLAKLPSVFEKNGTVTAGTASGICDGAACVIIASENAVKKHNLVPLARLVAYGIAGVEPTEMGIGPAPAIRKMLDKTDVKLNDVDWVEINEAFAPQTIACQRELDLDPAKLNQSGGAIALGHPLGASGSRITAHIVHSLRRKNLKYGIGSACIGGGQGIALLIEKM